MEWAEIDVYKTVAEICELLPDDDAKAFSLLTTAAASYALEAGFDEDKALTMFLAALREVRLKRERGVH